MSNQLKKIKGPVKKCSHGIIKGYCIMKTCPHYGIRFASLKKPVKKTKSVKAWATTQKGHFTGIFWSKKEAEEEMNVWLDIFEKEEIIPVLITPIDK